jgi:hypothetical protein
VVNPLYCCPPLYKGDNVQPGDIAGDIAYGGFVLAIRYSRSASFGQDLANNQITPKHGTDVMRGVLISAPSASNPARVWGDPLPTMGDRQGCALLVIASGRGFS